MFTLLKNKISTPECITFALPTLNNIALHFPLYLKCNELAFNDIPVEQKEFELHQYMTHELDLNLFSDIMSENMIVFTYGFQELNEAFELQLDQPISPQIENLIGKYEAFTSKIAA